MKFMDEDDRYCETIEETVVGSTPLSNITTSSVVAEIPITKIHLLKIANGTPMVFTQKGEVFGVRFVLKNSFKSKKSNFVINNFVMQIFATGKESFSSVRNIPVLTKIKTVIKEKEVFKKPEKKKVCFETKESDEEVF